MLRGQRREGVAVKHFGKLVFEDGLWHLDGLEPHVMIKLKAIFTKIAKSATCPITFKHTPETCVDLAWFTERYPLAISLTDRNYLYAQKDLHLTKVASLERFFKPEYTPTMLNLKKPLRAYQTQGVELFWEVQRLLCGDVVGLGKTPLAIGTFMKPECLPAAVVVQAHLPTQWREKIEEFSHLKNHVVRNGPVYQLPPADVYVFKYNQLAKWIDILISGIIKSAVFDEVQEFRRSESQKYDAGRKFSAAVEYVLGLSATPIYNYGEEIFNILDLIKPGCLGSREDFLREWANTYGRVISNPQALGTFLRENYLFLRRTRSDVGQELPPVNTLVETVDFDEEALQEVETTARMLALRVMQGSYIEKGQASRDLDMLVRQATGVSKAKHVAAYVRMIVESGEPVLLAGWHREVYDIWNRELADLGPVMYTGSESPTQKNEARRKFIAGESNLMMISLRSGIGLDGLQERASICVIGELDWSPQIHEQLIGRLARDGQKQQVTAIFLVSNSGSDPGIIEVLGLKSSQAQGIVDPLATATVNPGDASRIKKLAEQYLKGKNHEQYQNKFEDAVLASEADLPGNVELREEYVVAAEPPSPSDPDPTGVL